MKIEEIFDLLKTGFRKINDPYQRMNKYEKLDYNANFWQDSSKFIFDYTKNSIVIASIFVAAKNTDSWSVWIFGVFLWIILFSEISTRIENFIFVWIVNLQVSNIVAKTISFFLGLISYLLFSKYIDLLIFSIKSNYQKN